MEFNDGRPVLWALRDEECGHAFIASPILTALERVLEMAQNGGISTVQLIRVDGVDHCRRPEDCDRCTAREAAMMASSFRSPLALNAMKSAQDPFATVDFYQGLVTEGMDPRSAMHATALAIARHLFPPIQELDVEQLRGQG